MAEGERRNWRELCNAAREANDPDELLKILQELNKALKREEQVQRHFREATRANKSSGEIRFNNYRSVFLGRTKLPRAQKTGLPLPLPAASSA